MPSRVSHNEFARFLGIDSRIANLVNREMDAPAKWLGPSHRKVNHDIYTVARMTQKYGIQGAQAAMAHLMLDMLTTVNPVARKVFKTYEFLREMGYR